MKEMTFRVSELESFRQWREDEDAELDVLLSRLRGESPASEAMLAGTAFHKALETAQPGDMATLTGLGYTFNVAGDFELAIPPVREIRASKTYQGDGLRVTVSGQLDTIFGKRIEDHKTTGRFDPERYIGGYQWRLYLDIFGADCFRWNVFEIAATHDPLVWDVFALHFLEQYRYPRMGRDCEDLALAMGEFAIKHLPERVRAQRVAEAA